MPEYIEIPQWLNEAIVKYKGKLDFAVLESKLRTKKQAMDINAVPTQAELHDLQMRVSRILSAHGVLSDWNLVYCSYALQLLRVYKRFNPSVWAWLTDYKRELKIVAQKWVSRGLDPAIMLEIAKTIGAKEIAEFLP